MTIAEQFQVWIRLHGSHRDHVDEDLREPVERNLRGSLVHRGGVRLEAELTIERLARRGIGHTDRGMVNAERWFFGSIAGGGRKLQELERMTFWIAELDGNHASGCGRKLYRSVVRDRLRALRAGMLPRGCGVIGNECEVLKAQVGGGGVARIRAACLLEGFELQPLASAGEWNAHAAPDECKAPHFLGRYRCLLTDRKTERRVEGEQHLRSRRRQPEGVDREELRRQGRTQPRTLV